MLFLCTYFCQKNIQHTVHVIRSDDGDVSPVLIVCIANAPYAAAIGLYMCHRALRSLFVIYTGVWELKN